MHIKCGYLSLKMYKTKTCMSIHVNHQSSLVFVSLKNKKGRCKQMLGVINGRHTHTKKKPVLVLVLPES